MQRLFVVAGPAASGKTFFTKELAKRYPLEILDLDDRLDELITAKKARLDEIGMDVEKLASKEKLSAYIVESKLSQPSVPHIEIDGAVDFRKQIGYNL